jgi:hypothetical protein
MSGVSLTAALASPAQTIRRVEAMQVPPMSVWAVLVAVAVAGSALFGGSLSRPFPDMDIARGALWLTLSAGLSWPILLIGLRCLSGLPWIVLIHACLVTMFYGEVVLAAGALLNLLHLTGSLALPFNVAVIALSNVVMACGLAIQLASMRVPVWKIILAWFVLLNGSGALFFWAFYRWLGL